jgi:mannose-1-phosphate guanylyltransferase
MYVVILAGGGGTRLHPLSTPERPKPFLPLLGERSLLQQTVDRLFSGPELRDVGLHEADVTVVAAGSYAPLVREQLAGIAVVGEPVGRNTAAAIALAAIAIDRPDDEVMVVLPADHLIEREGPFRDVLRRAADGLATGVFGIGSPLVTLGIRPDRPSTDFGYLRPRIEAGEEVRGLQAYPLRAFVEKPSAARAGALLDEAGIAWNAGMFAWRRRAIREAFQAHAPDILTVVADGYAAGRLEAAYATVRATSIDFAVMEPAAAAGSVVMATMDVGWSDLGGWTALLEALGAHGSGRVVPAGEAADVGPDDLVVHRRDGRLLVASGSTARILDPEQPSALLVGARPDRPVVEALLARCSPSEARS